jgi:hypothetical protein
MRDKKREPGLGGSAVAEPAEWTRKNEKRCPRCGHWFNAWDEPRTKCRFCDPHGSAE